jgi:uncharacterized Zn-binding protein involved in type VI secretion
MSKPAAKQGDKIIATDTHILMVPSPAGPVPTPTPMPFAGTLTTGLSTDVFIEGKPAATVNSIAINQPPHIPTAGPFQKPPTNQGKIMVGSTGVFINGKPAARQGDQATTCNDPADAPVGTVMAVGKVFIGETGAAAPVKPPPPPPAQPSLLKAKLGQPGEIADARWQKNRAKCGEKVKMIVETKDFEDGTPASFIIWEEDVNGENTFIAQADGKVQADKVQVDWTYSPQQLELDLQREVEEEEGEPKCFFSVNIEGEEARSKILTFTHSLDIYLEDENKKPLDNVDYTVTFKDGTKKKGKFQGGHAKIDDAPYGRFVLEVEGYDLTFG